MNRLPLLTLLFLLTGTPCLVHAQKKGGKKKIEFSAKRTSFSKNIGKGATRLIGNVRFRHEGVEMFCDSAWLYDDQTLEAFNNVHISQGDSIHLYGDVLKYNGNTRKAELQKNIRMMDREMTLTTQVLYFDIKEQVANYTGGGKIETSENILTSEYGYYFTKGKELGFKKNVVLVNPEYTMKSDTLRYNTQTKVAWFHGPTTITSPGNFIYCEDGYYDTWNDLSRFSRNSYILSGKQMLRGDSLFYDRKKGLGRAKNNILIIDSAEKVTIQGQFAEYYEQSGTSFVSGKAFMTQVYEEDTLYLGADTLHSSFEMKDSAGAMYPDRKARLLKAYRKVKIYKSDLQGSCDSLVYEYRDSGMVLYHRPLLWSEKMQISGEQIRIQTGGGEIRKLYVEGAAFMISAEDTIRFNQIKGKRLTGYFIKNELYKIHVEGNGQTLYYVRDNKKMIGQNRTDCSEMDIYMNDTDIRKITFLDKPDGKVTPLSMLSGQDLRLKGFGWFPERRPTRDEVCGKK
ncbi:MAG: organic solvent tolerance protein OstA [Bacteroidia bacterium]|nr:organic solvent tolerance protein OstA [Bacteroidia bacterium]